MFRHCADLTEDVLGVILSVSDPFGAFGCADVSRGTAKALADLYKDAVLLIDCSRGFDMVSWMEKEQPGIAYDLGDVLCDRCDPSDAVYRSDGGFFIMPAASDASEVGAAEVGLLASEISPSFAAVVICCPAADFCFAQKISEFASLTAVCCSADELGISAAAKLRRMLPEEASGCGIVVADYSSEAVKKGELLCLDDCIDTAQARLLAVIPKKQTMRAEAFGNFAKRLSGVKTPLVKL